MITKRIEPLMKTRQPVTSATPERMLAASVIQPAYGGPAHNWGGRESNNSLAGF